MKIVWKNAHKAIAIHQGMPFLFYLESRDFILSWDENYEVKQKTIKFVGYFLDDNDVMPLNHIEENSKYHKMFLEVWRG